MKLCKQILVGKRDLHCVVRNMGQQKFFLALSFETIGDSSLPYVRCLAQQRRGREIERRIREQKSCTTHARIGLMHRVTTLDCTLMKGAHLVNRIDSHLRLKV